jgi:phosphoglycolate phosphatase-like HAD superfamily hydrolase
VAGLIVFDLDGTLLDRMPAVAEAANTLELPKPSSSVRV